MKPLLHEQMSSICIHIYLYMYIYNQISQLIQSDIVCLTYQKKLQKSVLLVF